MTTPEIEKPKTDEVQKVEKVEGEKPEAASEVQQTSAKPMSTQQVIVAPADDSDDTATQMPSPKAVTVTIPATIQQLDDWSKGDPQNALTWFAMFWLRLIKKALHFGWKVVMKVQKKEIIEPSKPL